MKKSNKKLIIGLVILMAFSLFPNLSKKVTQKAFEIYVQFQTKKAMKRIKRVEGSFDKMVESLNETKELNNKE